MTGEVQEARATARLRRRVAVLIVPLTATLLAAGCTSGRQVSAASSQDSPPDSPTATRSASTPSPTVTTAPRSTVSASPSSKPTPGVPQPGSMQVPATTAGNLSQRSFPTPRELGAGWRYVVDPGDAEQGYAGNGTPSLARDPQEIVQTAVPFGCARPDAMTAPAHALEVDYAFRGARVVTIKGVFDSPAAARSFFTARAANLRACLGRSGGPAIGPLVARLRRLDHTALVSDRTPASDGYRELSVLHERTVTLVAARIGPGGAPLTPDRANRFADRFRR